MQFSYKVKIYEPGGPGNNMTVEVEAPNEYKAKSIAESQYRGFKALTARKA